MTALTYDREPWSLFAPEYVYRVEGPDGDTLGWVRPHSERARWWASTKTWAGGGDLRDTFRTRAAAGAALLALAEGRALPGDFGGHFVEEVAQ